jgi:hypothetical protein
MPFANLGLTLIAAFLPGFAQELKETRDEVFWDSRQRQEAGAAAQLILARNPLVVAVLRDEGLRWKVWREPEFLGNSVPPLNGAWLDELRDNTGNPDLRGKAEDEISKDKLAYVKVLNQALINAYETPADVFAKSAAENAHVTFAHLWEDPERYRGKVIPIKGRLIRLRKNNAPLGAQKMGIPFVYQGWIQGPTRGSHPFWVLFPYLPEGLKEAEKMDREVIFNGYFLKKMKYPAGDGSKYLQTPLLVGPTVILAKEPPAPPSVVPTSMNMVGVIGGVIVAVALGLVLLHWYFHRGDQALKKHLQQLQNDRVNDLRDD